MSIRGNSTNPKVSVIIPVWNPGAGIRRCVSSLRNQTLRDIEMIFVDDCGSDGAMDVVRAAAAEDPRIRIIMNAENVGPGISRNAAIDVARGEYLSFVDADDYVDVDFLEILYEKGKAERLDIVRGAFVYEREENGVYIQKYSNLNAKIRTGLSNGAPLFYLFHTQFQSALYHSRLFANPDVRFGSTSHGEDTLFLLKVCCQCNAFAIDGKRTYRMNNHESSAENTFTKGSLENRIVAWKEEAEYLTNQTVPNPYASQYLARNMKYYLALQTHVSRKAGMEEVATGFLSDLRDLAANYLCKEGIKEDDLTIFALVRHGENLAEYPWFKSRHSVIVEEYADLLATWVRFLDAHPESRKNIERASSVFGDVCADLC